MRRLLAGACNRRRGARRRPPPRFRPTRPADPPPGSAAEGTPRGRSRARAAARPRVGRRRCSSAERRPREMRDPPSTKAPLSPRPQNPRASSQSIVKMLKPSYSPATSTSPGSQVRPTPHLPGGPPAGTQLDELGVVGALRRRHPQRLNMNGGARSVRCMVDM